MKNKIFKVIPWILLVVMAAGFAGCKPETITTTTTKTTTATTTLPAQTVTSTTTLPGETITQTGTTVTETLTTTVTESPTTTTTTPPETRTITDMYGRELVVPYEINRVLCAGPVEMELVFMLAPDKLAGLCFAFNGNPPLVPQEYTSLPVVGGWFGKNEGNYETFIAAGPDVILDGSQATLDERQTKFGDIPVVGINEGDLMFNYKDAILFLGDLLGVPEKAQELVDFYTDAAMYVSSIVSQVPAKERLKVYYAEGTEGLNTDPLGSMHTALMAFCGGENVADVQLLPGYGMAEVSFEQILMWDPDVIIIGRGSQTVLYDTIMNDENWKQLRAVQSGQVFLRPDNPYSWFDGPPGPAQILGMYWMVHTLYPQQTQGLDLAAKVKEFYSKFFHYNLTEAELAGLIGS